MYINVFLLARQVLGETEVFSILLQFWKGCSNWDSLLAEARSWVPHMHVEAESFGPFSTAFSGINVPRSWVRSIVDSTPNIISRGCCHCITQLYHKHQLKKSFFKITKIKYNVMIENTHRKTSRVNMDIEWQYVLVNYVKVYIIIKVKHIFLIWYIWH